MTKVYNKLVRDRIPEIIEAEGRKCQVEIMDETEYRQALLKKLVEEAEEVRNAPAESLAGEIADLYEVIDALLAAHELSKDTVLGVQAQKRRVRGSFDSRIKLLNTE
jgi:predicted house-cleaning noncanonical NTP pyrophosphatase (MazG superfamily)